MSRHRRRRWHRRRIAERKRLAFVAGYLAHLGLFAAASLGVGIYTIYRAR